MMRNRIETVPVLLNNIFSRRRFGASVMFRIASALKRIGVRWAPQNASQLSVNVRPLDFRPFLNVIQQQIVVVDHCWIIQMVLIRNPRCPKAVNASLCTFRAVIRKSHRGNRIRVKGIIRHSAEFLPAQKPESILSWSNRRLPSDLTFTSQLRSYF